MAAADTHRRHWIRIGARTQAQFRVDAMLSRRRGTVLGKGGRIMVLAG